MAIYLLQGVMLALPTVLTPSPFRIYLITEVLQHGFRRTLPAIFAPAITDGPIILLVVLILSRMPQWMLDALRFGGGLYLLYLATNVVRLLRRTTGPTLRVRRTERAKAWAAPSSSTRSTRIPTSSGLWSPAPSSCLGWRNLWRPAWPFCLAFTASSSSA